jgi:hypothetical protein
VRGVMDKIDDSLVDDMMREVGGGWKVKNE